MEIAAQVLEGVIVFETQPSQTKPNSMMQKRNVNDNFRKNKTSNDNKKTLSWRKLIKN